MAEHYPNPKEKIPSPNCGNRVHRDGKRCHDRSMHGEQKETHTCVRVLLQRDAEDVLYLRRLEKAYQGHVPNLSGRGDKDPFFVEEYAAGFKLDGWYRFHGITEDELDQSFLRLSRLRHDYGPYQGKREDTGTSAPDPPPTIRLPHSKGAMPDRHQTPTGSELADREIGGTDWEGTGEELEEGEVQGSLHGALIQSLMMQAVAGTHGGMPGHGKVPRRHQFPGDTRGRGKRRQERGRGSRGSSGALKQQRLESSSSEQWDESGGSASRSGSGCGLQETDLGRLTWS